MKTLPKILPWFANKNGISEELAAKLWRRASGEIVELLGSTETPEVHKRTIERFLDLVESESAIDAQAIVTPADFTWMLRHQSRVTFLSLLAVENTSRAWRNNWTHMWAPYTPVQLGVAAACA